MCQGNGACVRERMILEYRIKSLFYRISGPTSNFLTNIPFGPIDSIRPTTKGI